MALTFGDFLSIFTTNDPSGGRAIKATFDTGVDDAANYLTKNDPAGGRAIKVVNVGAPLGPQFWAEAYNAGTQATSSWTPVGAATNINAAIRPKGTGAIIAAIPDGTATGGNARGQYAVDLQTDRNAATQVASGTYSVIVGGRRNTVTGEHGFIGAGWANSTTGNRGVVVGGESNSAATNVYQTIVGGNTNSINGNGARSFIGGGSSNSVTQADAVVVGGQSNTASGQWSFVGGGSSNSSTWFYTTVCGGTSNSAGGEANFIGGGQGNSLGGTNNTGWRTICGGYGNTMWYEQCNSAFIGGGYQNTVHFGTYGGFIGGGGGAGGNSGNSISGTLTTLVGGGSNRVGNGYGLYADYGFLGGGRSNAVDTGANYGVLGGGQENTVRASYGFIGGGYQGTASLYGQQVHASGRFAANGDAQAHELIWRRAITGTLSAELFLDGASVRAILPGTNSVWHGTIDAVAVCTVTGDGSTTVGHVEATSYKVTIKRIGTSTSLVGTVQEIGTTNADASMATGVFSIDNDDTNEALRIRFTPPATAGSTTVIRAVATFRGTQIQY